MTRKNLIEKLTSKPVIFMNSRQEYSLLQWGDELT